MLHIGRSPYADRKTHETVGDAVTSEMQMPVTTPSRGGILQLLVGRSDILAGRYLHNFQYATKIT